MANSTDESDLIDFEPLSWTSTITKTTTGKFALDVLDRDRQPGRKALDDHGQGPSVGFAGRQVTQHRMQVTFARRGPRGPIVSWLRHREDDPSRSVAEERLGG